VRSGARSSPELAESNSSNGGADWLDVIVSARTARGRTSRGEGLTFAPHEKHVVLRRGGRGSPSTTTTTSSLCTAAAASFMSVINARGLCFNTIGAGCIHRLPLKEGNDPVPPPAPFGLLVRSRKSRPQIARATDLATLL
jgi:hypothetical protein